MILSHLGSILKGLVSSFSFVILKTIKLSQIRSFLPREFLSPIQIFAKDGYNSLLYEKLEIESQECILILGGYLGDSLASYVCNFDCNFYVFEPIPIFYRELSEKFGSQHKIKLINMAASNANGFLELHIEGDKTGISAAGSHDVSVPCCDFAFFISSIKEPIGLIEINIEGGEYDVLERLIEKDQLKLFKYLQIQFHLLDPAHELKRAKIRNKLRDTHDLVFDYEWVWERWERKSLRD